MSTSCQQCGKQVVSDLPTYVGQLVFVEAVREGTDAKTYSNYNGGEYLIVRQSPNILYGVKLTADVYYGRQLTQLPVVGTGRYAVISAKAADTTYVREWLDKMWIAAYKPERGEKLQWVEHIYTEAKETCRTIAELIGHKLTDPSKTYAADPQRLETLENRVAAMQKDFEALRSKLRGV